MEIINDRLDLPDGYYVLLLAKIPQTTLYLAVIISEKDWCNHQMKDTKNGTVRGHVKSVKIAQGEAGQDLKFVDVDDLMITDDFGRCWNLKAGELTLTKIGSSTFLGEESKINLGVIYSSL